MMDFSLVKGIFLVSEPFLPDPNFNRTVVLLTEHDEDGSVGFVLNRKTELTINDVLEDFPKFDAPLFIGGPVEQNTLHFLYTSRFTIPGGKPVIAGVNWGGDFEAIRDLIRLGEMGVDDIRFFVGYSGWTPNQLEEEMEEKAWIITPANEEFVLHGVDENMWREVLRNMGDEYRVIANYPEDPRLN